MTIYLYVKTHKKTGLKYLGKTERDPHQYIGSGTYWRAHLSKHGHDIETEILRECATNKEVKEWGLYYSQLWNVVESDEWANLMEEKGDGVSSEMAKRIWANDESRQKLIASLNQAAEDPSEKQRKSEWMKIKWCDPAYRDNHSRQLRERWQQPGVREHYRELMIGEKNPMSDSSVREAQRTGVKAAWDDPVRRGERIKKSNSENSKALKSHAAKTLWENPSYREKQRSLHSGKNNGCYDHTIYHWIRDDGTEEQCTRHDLYTKYSFCGNKLGLVVSGDRKSHKGWSIKR